MKCDCGKVLIFKGGYSLSSMKVDRYECYECGSIYEKVETKELRKIEGLNEKI